MSIQVTKTDTGWIIQKDGTTYSITDKNKDGRFDKNDLCKNLSGNGSSLNAEDILDIKYNIMGKNEMTPAEMLEYSNYQKQKETQANYQQQQQQYQQYVQEQQEQYKSKAKKRKIWSGIAMGLGAFIPIMSGVGAGLLGASVNSWAYNGADKSGQWMAGLSSGLLGATTSFMGMMPFFMKNMSQFNQPMIYSQPMFNMPQQNNYNLNGMLQSFFNDNQAQQEQYEQLMAERTKQAKTAQAKKDADELRSVFTENEDTIPKENIDMLNKIARPSKEEYSEKDSQIIAQLRKTPYVPINCIDTDGNQKDKKITTSYADTINSAILDYEEAEVEDPETQDIYKENMETIRNLLSSSEFDKYSYKSIIAAIDTIISAPKKTHEIKLEVKQ